jgi:hypothetical protein
MTTRLIVAIFALTGPLAFAHRLDEYLQGTIISVESNRLQAQMTLTPGVAVFPFVMSSIDSDGNGMLSEQEQRAYAARVLRDLSLAIDGNRLKIRLLAVHFPTVAEMKEGIGQIQLDFDANLPRGGRNRKLTFENHHLSRIAAYQVNCLVPRDPHIRIVAQNRNYTQSSYELEYEDAGVLSASPFTSWSGPLIWTSPIALLLFGRLTLLWRRRLGVCGLRRALEPPT